MTAAGTSTAKFRGAAIALAAALALAACSPSGQGKYLEVERGGFLFDYQLGQVTAGFTAKPLKRLPDGATLEASFENPAGGDALIVRQPMSASAEEYSFMSPPITGVVKDKEYEVILRVRDAEGNELQRIEMAFASEMDSSVLPQTGPAPPKIAPPTVTFPPQQ